MAQWVNAARYREVAAQRPIYYAYYQGVRPQAEPCLELFFDEEGHVGFAVPMEIGRYCLILEILPEEFGSFRSDPDGMFEAGLRKLPGMGSRLARAVRQGTIRGTRGIENYLRVPYGPGWALTGDAAFCKDPITGLGIGDAFGQAFLLSEALQTVVSGGEWEPTMRAFHERRDSVYLPAYESTVALARSSAVPSRAIGWLRAVVGSPWLAHRLAASMPDVMSSGGLLPEKTARQLQRTADAYADASALALSMAS
jgi:hypothetical protein